MFCTCIEVKTKTVTKWYNGFLQRHHVIISKALWRQLKRVHYKGLPCKIDTSLNTYFEPRWIPQPCGVFKARSRIFSRNLLLDAVPLHTH